MTKSQPIDLSVDFLYEFHVILKPALAKILWFRSKHCVECLDSDFQSEIWNSEALMAGSDGWAKLSTGCSNVL